MAYAFVQFKASTSQSGTSVVSPSITLTAGNLAVVFLKAGGFGAVNVTSSSVTDGLGNTYVFVSHIFSSLLFGGYNVDLYYCQNCLGGTTTVTGHYPSSAGFAELQILEYSGMALTSCLDSHAEDQSGTGTPTKAITTTNADDIIVGLAISASSSPPCTASTLTDRTGNFIGGFGAEGEHELTPAGTITVTTTGNSSGSWIISLGAFKVVGSSVRNTLMLQGTGV